MSAPSTLFRLLICSVAGLSSLLLHAGTLPEGAPVNISVTARDSPGRADVPANFLGLSFEMDKVLSRRGHYYFDANKPEIVAMFRTLGIRSLRVGANAVDDPRCAIPQEKDVDALFEFARAAALKVIYSFRLKNGDSVQSAHLAAYIEGHDGDVLDCFAIGNEPDDYFHDFDAYYAAWKPYHDAILRAVPQAMFDGPSVSSNRAFPVRLAATLGPADHLKMASDHFYFLGDGRKAEKDPSAARARMLSNQLHHDYQMFYDRVGAKLAALQVPYRMDEGNSNYNGGARDSSDTYASTLWALDCIHWWAQQPILGMNFHTNERVSPDGGFIGTNYAAFVRRADGSSFDVRPQAYAYLAFSQGAHGRPMQLEIDQPSGTNFNSYAYRDHDGSCNVTLINKSFGADEKTASVTLHFPDSGWSKVERLDVKQSENNVAAKTGVMVGGAPITPQGTWTGTWTQIDASTSDLTVQVAPASAAIVRLWKSPR